MSKEQPSNNVPRLHYAIGTLLPLAALPAVAWADLGEGQMDFGGVGLLQTPTARMAPLGEFSFTYNEVEPYTRYAISVQPLDWFELGFRYTQIGNRRYSASDEGIDTIDKGVDFKFRLLEEERYQPEVALGFRDVGGTGLFAGEYLVASKRWYDLDFSLGLGWGYVGGRGDIDNPLGYIDDRFDSRPEDGGGDQGGEFALNQLFRGPTALFGGVEYQTPWEPLSLQLEYEGNDYLNEPLNNTFEQDSPFNVGARYELSDNLAFRVGWERGNTLMAGATLSLNLAEIGQPKRDPAPVPLTEAGASDAESWLPIAVALQNNAGIHANRISIDDDELLVEAEPTKYRSLLKSEARANRILHNTVSPHIDTFRYRWQSMGLNLREDVHSREAFVSAARASTDESTYRYGIYATAATQPIDEAPEGKTVYAIDPSHYSWNIAPGYNQNIGGPDGYLYQIYAKLNGAYRTDANGWFSGQLAWNLYDNLENYDYISESDLPRVRTYIGEYLSETSLGIYNLQYTRTARLADDWYGMAYGGILEMMYSGVGGEVLYRPFDSDVALGLDLNWVKQREFDQRFGLRDYDTWTGHATAYVETGIEDVLAQISVGRYLAQDIGMTLNLSRTFDSGVRLGAWATFTDAGDAYGEGSFDKGLYVAIPFDAFFTSSSRSYTTVSWQPLTRDGGARLARRYGLYDLTQVGELGSYWDNFDEAME